MDMLYRIWNEILRVTKVPPPRSQVCTIRGLDFERKISTNLVLTMILRTANVLVRKDIAKVSDFGISRFAEETSTAQALPWRWTAPEVKEVRAACGARDDVTSKSDVFSFGGLIYEVLRLGEVPFLKRAKFRDQSSKVS